MTHRTKPISALHPQCDLFGKIADALNEAFKEANIPVTLGLGTSASDEDPSMFFGIYVRGAEKGDEWPESGQTPRVIRFGTQELGDRGSLRGVCVRGSENTDDLDLNEPLGKPACNLGEACESCQ